jgi:flavorubredoxin
MSTVRLVTDDIYYLGVDEPHVGELFEGIHPIPEGVSYNAYLLKDEKTVLFDTVDRKAIDKFMVNLQEGLGGRPLDYFIVQHMEPDHAYGINHVLKAYPNVTVIANEKTFMIMHQFGVDVPFEQKHQVEELDTISFGKHNFVFAFAPMVHWPEVLVSFDTTTGCLFSADAFGSFGTLDGNLFDDEVDYDRDWHEKARRYFVNIVGKYGPHVQSILGKAVNIIKLENIKMFLPTHGHVWRTDLMYLVNKYLAWSSYEPEEKGVLVVYASMYGNTEKAVEYFVEKLKAKGVTNITVRNASYIDTSYLISDTFRLSHVVIACPTYNLGIFPLMNNYLNRMKSLNLKNRTFGIIENGSWAPKAGDLIEEFLDKEMKEMTILDDRVTVISSLGEINEPEINGLVDSLVQSLNT